MINEQARIVRVNWDGPFSVEEVLKMHNEETDYGVYQIYGRHVVFGAGSLLYVGMAEEQTFATRFGQHQQQWLKQELDVTVHVGRLNEEDYHTDSAWKDWRTKVHDVEALTIYWHSPPYNSKNIGGYYRDPLHVQNWGRRGALLPEYTSHWKLLRPDDEKQG